MAGEDHTTRIINTDPSSDDPGIRFEEWDAYHIECLLGEGGMARVYKAFDPKLNRYVALKFIRSSDENHKKRLLREARAQAQIEHDSVCKIYEVGEVQGKPYIAMQPIQGGVLSQLASEMSLQKKVLIFERVCDAVHLAHKLGIIHRDIKPSNIMVEQREDGSFRPYVMDFGIAREITDPGITATNMIIGTPGFMAPEQISGTAESVDRRTDVFSLGATLYMVLSGKPPFKGTGVDVLMKVVSEDPVPLKKIAPSLPDDLEIIVTKCLEKNPNARYDSARALGDDLKRYIDGEPILARRSSLTHRFAKKIRKNKTIAAVTAAALLIVIASAAVGIFSYIRTAQQIQVVSAISRSVEAMDWTMKVAMMSPLHDIRKERSLVLTKMLEIKQLMKDAGSAGAGPGNYALGRGFLALHDYGQARIHFEKAWNSGYREKEVANGLGLVFGEQYQQKRLEANRISDATARQAKLTEFERDYRTPAIQYLKLGSGSRIQSLQYGEALLAFYEKNYDKSLKLATSLADASPALHEAFLLKGDVYSRFGEDAFHDGKYDEAIKYFDKGAKEYEAAKNIARSDPKVYESLCSLWRSVMEIQFETGGTAKATYEKSIAECKSALIADADSPTAYNYLAQTSWRWGEDIFGLGEDPTSAFTQAIELSRKSQILEPDGATGYYIMGTAYGYLADYELRIGKDPSTSLDASIKALQLALERDPRDGATYVNLGASYFSQGAKAMSSGLDSKQYFMKAIDAYLKATQIAPLWNAYANLGNAYTQVGQDAASRGEDPMQYFQKSIEHYQTAKKLRPNHWLILTNFSSSYVAKMEYELDHGKDVSESMKNITSLCEQSLKLNPDNPYPRVNLADGYLYYAQYEAAQGGDASKWLSKVEPLLKPLINAEIPEVFLGLAVSKKLEAENLLQQKRDPGLALEAARKYASAAGKINNQEPEVPYISGETYLIEAQWQKFLNRSPEASLNAAKQQAEIMLKLNPHSAAAYSQIAEIELMRVDWKSSRKQPVAEALQAAFTAIERSIRIKSDNGKAYSIKARVLMHDARFAEAVKNFEKAFTLNPVIKAANMEFFTKAQSLH
jgi:eukaryotic-like serine/threonine-protein kinase